MFLLVAIVPTVMETILSLLFELSIDRFNPGTFGVALTACCAWVSQSLTPFLGAIAVSLSASQSSSLSFGSPKSPFLSSQFSWSENLSGALSSSVTAASRSIRLLLWTFNTSVCLPGRLFADTAGGTGDLLANLNAATQSCKQFDLDALTISSVRRMYPMVIICFFWAQDSFCVAHRFWLPCHISKKLWTLTILCTFFWTSSLHFQVNISICLIWYWVITS